MNYGTTYIRLFTQQWRTRSVRTARRTELYQDLNEPALEIKEPDLPGGPGPGGEGITAEDARLRDCLVDMLINVIDVKASPPRALNTSIY